MIKKTKSSPLINIITRTSNRPIAFSENVNSVSNQTYKNILHIVSSDNIDTEKYIENQLHKNMLHVRLNKDEIIRNDKSPEYDTGGYFPYNLYMNLLLCEVQEGYVIFLDDDDVFVDEHSVEKIVNKIKESKSKDTIFIWQMKMPKGYVLPPKKFMNTKPVIGYIGSPCIAFHISKLDNILWDAWKCGDFRFIEKIYDKVKNKVFICEPLVEILQIGRGKKKDIIKK